MSRIEIGESAKDLIYLVSCAANSEKPDSQRCAAMDTEAVLKAAKLQMLSVAAACALEQAVALSPSWQNAKGSAVRRQILYEAARAEVLRELEKNGIWYLPLKGCVIKSLYPRPMMREMADNDVLCDAEKMAEIRDIMLRLGYTCESYEKDNHDVYEKNGLSFELHRSLFISLSSSVFTSYYGMVKDRLVRDEDKQYGYHMTDEDFYIHLISHMYKHYSHAGVGLRALLDVYIYNREKGSSLDRAYLETELKKLSLDGFERDMRPLAEKVFTLQPLSDEEQGELAYFIDSNCFGLSDTYFAHRLRNDDSRKAKAGYLFRRIFPDSDYLELSCPVVYRHRILYPFMVVYRAGKGLFTRPGKLFWEFKRVRNFRSEDFRGDHHTK